MTKPDPDRYRRLPPPTRLDSVIETQGQHIPQVYEPDPTAGVPDLGRQMGLSAVTAADEVQTLVNILRHPNRVWRLGLYFFWAGVVIVGAMVVLTVLVARA